MMFLFTSSPKIGSKAIRWATSEDVSHFSIVFDESEYGYGIVFHSHFSGVQFDWFNSFYRRNSIVYALKPKAPLQLNEEERIYQAIISKTYGKEYDRTLFLEFAFYALRKKVTGSQIPAKGRLGKNDAYLCTELASHLKQAKPAYVPQILTGDLITPYQLYNNMKTSTELESVPWITQKLLKG